MEHCSSSEVLFQRRCSNFVYVVPFGLKELMSDISREVLRSRPEDIYSFIASYLESLLITRENIKVASSVEQQLTISSMIVSPLLKESNISGEQATAAAKIIQQAFRRYSRKKRSNLGEFKIDIKQFVKKILFRCNLTFEQATVAALIIQRAFRLYQSRVEDTGSSFQEIKWNKAAKTSINIVENLRISQSEEKKAASLIKAAYRGYYTRRILKDLWAIPLMRKTGGNLKKSLDRPPLKVNKLGSGSVMKKSIIWEHDYDKLIEDNRNQAAIVIQRAFRLHLGRHAERLRDEFAKYIINRIASDLNLPQVVMQRESYYKVYEETGKLFDEIFDVDINLNYSTL